MKVAVLLAGYEGQKFIYEQIFSLIDQSEAYVEIFVRVDGTSTTFKETIKNISLKYKNVHYIEGDSKSSPSSNFYKLIMENDLSDFDYFALCDQDDIWLKDKLKTAINKMPNDDVLGYSSGFTTYNNKGKTKKYSLGKISTHDFYFQAGGPGCTFVFNKKAMTFIKSYIFKNKQLLNVLAHDWLLYFILRFNGKRWIIDEDSKIMYRQHSNNVAGVNKGFSAKFNRLRILFNGWYFHDLKILLNFAKNNGARFNSLNPFSLRRSKLESLLIYLYINLYFKFIIWSENRAKNE